jgi:hypothetical protein
LGTGVWIGWALKPTTPVSITDLQAYMNRVVNAEEADERFNLTRKMLHDADRRTMPRVDAGATAKVYRMRRRRRVYRRSINAQP